MLTSNRWQQQLKMLLLRTLYFNTYNVRCLIFRSSSLPNTQFYFSQLNSTNFITTYWYCQYWSEWANKFFLYNASEVNPGPDYPLCPLYHGRGPPPSGVPHRSAAKFLPHCFDVWTFSVCLNVTTKKRKEKRSSTFWCTKLHRHR